MKYILDFFDSDNRWRVLVNDEPNKIGYEYKIGPFLAKVVKDAYDEKDFHYFRKAKKPIPVNTEIIIDCWWQNFYGSYFSVKYNGNNYDVNTDCIKLLKEIKE